MKTATEHPRSAMERESAPTTSASPPTLAYGTASALIMATRKRWVISAELDLAEILGRLLGRRGIDVEARAPLEARDLGQLGHDLDVPVIVVEARVAAGRAVHDEVVVRPVQGLVDALQRFLKGVGQRLELALLRILERRDVAPGQDPGLERKPRGEGLEGDEVLVLHHESFSFPKLLLDHVAGDAAFLEPVMLERPVQLLGHSLRDDGRGHELGVAVLQGGAGVLAVVLEDQDVAEAVVVLEVHHAVPEGPEHVLDLLRRQLAQLLRVIGRLDDDLVRADPVHLVVEASPRRSSPPSIWSAGNLVGTTPTVQPGGVGSGPGSR